MVAEIFENGFLSLEAISNDVGTFDVRRRRRTSARSSRICANDIGLGHRLGLAGEKARRMVRPLSASVLKNPGSADENMNIC
jgi:hypothetical protein